MSDEIDKTIGKRRGAKQDRLASALRENLKRRKVQARERAATPDSSPDGDSAPDEGTASKSGG